MKKTLYPFLALVFGAAGYILRARQLSEAVDPDTGLLLLNTRPPTPSSASPQAPLWCC